MTAFGLQSAVSVISRHSKCYNRVRQMLFQNAAALQGGTIITGATTNTAGVPLNRARIWWPSRWYQLNQ